MTIKTIFLDRDGVINKDINYLYKVKDFQFIDGIFDSCIYFQKLGFKIIVVTNQSGISRNYFSEKEYKNLTNWMLNEFRKNGIKILDVFHCPHLPNSNCSCRKPMPGMFIDAKKKYNIDMENSWLIGDKETDIIAANSSGISNTILVKSNHKINELDSKAKYIFESINHLNEVIIN